MKKAAIKNLPNALARLVTILMTSTYIGAYRYHTLDPIERIHRCQDELSRSKLVKALADFRRLKEEELAFVAKAAALSAAAVIGVFSWPTTQRTVWATKLLWNWSFFMSIFSMVGSAPTRLLQYLPADPLEDFDEENIQHLLSLFLQPPSKSAKPGSVRKMSRRMLWAWQCPAMLMSYSWVFFLAGYTLHILTPVFDQSQADVSWKMSIVTVCGCGLIALNFIFCATLFQCCLQKRTPFEWILDLLTDSETTDA